LLRFITVSTRVSHSVYYGKLGFTAAKLCKNHPIRNTM